MHVPARFVTPTLLALAMAPTAARAQQPTREHRPPRVATSPPAAAHAPTSVAVAPAEVARLLGALSDDSLEGRDTGSRGSAAAARIIAAELRAAGVRPAGDSGWFQRVPVARTTVTVQGRTRTRTVLLPDLAAGDTLATGSRLPVAAVNVVGVLPGTDPQLRDEAVVVTAHYDHLGIGQPVNGDSIYNGADDDASGTAAVLVLARLLGRGPAPKRTVVFLLVTGEERGMLGTRWYLDHPVVPLDHTIANLNIEMIGRPDSLAGGPGAVWLTGFDRSTMGAMLREAGVPIIPDPRPDQHFFERSDNYAFVRRGIVAHTLSTYDLHADYHRPSDEARFTDPAHMAQVINAAVRAVRLLADGPAPQWAPGGR
jgi:Peptidase family M28